MSANPIRYAKQAGVLLVLILVLQLSLAYLPATAEYYHRYIFLPIQYVRSLLTIHIPAALGDWLYLLAGAALWTAILKWIINLFRIRPLQQYLLKSLLRSCSLLLLVYFLLLLFWGGNYYRPSLTQQMDLPPATELVPADIVAFDSVLVQRLNSLAPGYRPVSPEYINREGLERYQSLSGWYQVKAKSSLFGNAMSYIGIAGYFNPFTGEAQVNGQSPDFMLPFLMLHEMAHQTGIAAEDDANLMAYIQCVRSTDTAILYSGYFNLWLYAQRQVRFIDSSKARVLKESLNTLSLGHLDTLRAIRNRYYSSAEQYSSNVYDAYLKLGNQAMGIESYRNVAFTALCWERKYYQGKGR